MAELERYVKSRQAATTAESHYMVATSEDTRLTVGSVVRIITPFGERIGSMAKASMGEFLIIDIEHMVGEDQYYTNRFRAIPPACTACRCLMWNCLWPSHRWRTLSETMTLTDWDAFR